jgi:hypothetical protein
MSEARHAERWPSFALRQPSYISPLAKVKNRPPRKLTHVILSVSEESQNAKSLTDFESRDSSLTLRMTNLEVLTAFPILWQKV